MYSTFYDKYKLIRDFTAKESDPCLSQFLRRANHVPDMTKVLRKAIMKRSELERKYVKNETSENLKSYIKQRNFCSQLYNEERKILRKARFK